MRFVRSEQNVRPPHPTPPSRIFLTFAIPPNGAVDCSSASPACGHGPVALPPKYPLQLTLFPLLYLVVFFVEILMLHRAAF